MIKPDRRPIPVKFYNSIFPVFGKEKLNFDSLIKKSRKRSGLDDLGPDFNEEALQMLIYSINSEAPLHPFGVLMIREKLIGQLENRLWAQYWFNKHPEILEQEVLPIILITGLQRTGTTKLQRLLSKVEGVRPLWCYEALFPAPIKTKNEYRTRLSKTRRNEKAVKWLSPTFHNIHPIYHDRPEEDVLLLDMNFMSTSAEAIMHVPTYAQWLDEQDHKKAYEYERKLLLLLQWQRNGSHWILKSPHHLEYMEEIKSTFSKVDFIWSHRELDQCIPSFLSMLYHSRRMFSDSVLIDRIKEHWLAKIKRMLNAGLNFRYKNPDDIIDVQYDDLLIDENNTIKEILDRLNLKAELLNNNEMDQSRKYKSKHIYSMEDWFSENENIHEIFPGYHSFYNQLPNS